MLCQKLVRWVSNNVSAYRIGGDLTLVAGSLSTARIGPKAEFLSKTPRFFPVPDKWQRKVLLISGISL